MSEIQIAKPSNEEARRYLEIWNSLENYVLQESSLKRLFQERSVITRNVIRTFSFSILQILPKSLSDGEVVKIEGRYKDKLLTEKYGLNDN